MVTKCITFSQKLTGTISAKVAFLPCQSKLPIWSARIAPQMEQVPSEITTSNGYHLILEVMGHIIASPERALYDSRDSTSAGRLPDCSRPVCGSKSSQIISPLRGMYFTISHFLYRLKLQRILPHVYFPEWLERWDFQYHYHYSEW